MTFHKNITPLLKSFRNLQSSRWNFRRLFCSAGLFHIFFQCFKCIGSISLNTEVQ